MSEEKFFYMLCDESRLTDEGGGPGCRCSVPLSVYLTLEELLSRPERKPEDDYGEAEGYYDTGDQVIYTVYRCTFGPCTNKTPVKKTTWYSSLSRLVLIGDAFDEDHFKWKIDTMEDNTFDRTAAFLEEPVP